MQALCIHGVGAHPPGGQWQHLWASALSRSFARQQPDAELHTSYFHYDSAFENTTLTPSGLLSAIAKLSVSGLSHGFDDFFSGYTQHGARRPTARAARGLKDSLRWTAGMLLQWAEDDTLREQLCQRLAAQIEAEDPDIIFAHSLGSLIAYDTFQRAEYVDLCKGRTFVSLGSQIGNPFVRSLFAGRIKSLPNGYWYNLYNVHDDVFTSSLSLHEDNFEQVLTSFDISGFADHDAVEYLAHPNVSHSVFSDLASRPPSARRARQMRGHVAASGSHQQRALIIGIDQYPAEDMRLEGCVNDAFLMSELLQENGFEADNIRLLLNRRATTEEIWRRLEWLLSGTRAGQQRVLCFSGHGAQLADYGSDEKVDRVDECLVPYDFDWTAERAITDDRFHALYSQLPYDASFVAILDCCHSGGMTRSGGARARGLSPPDDIRHRTMRWCEQSGCWIYRTPPSSKDLRGNSRTREIGYLGGNGQRRLFRATDVLSMGNREFNARRRELAHHSPYLPVILQACEEDQLAYEYRHGATPYGAFSYSLAQTLRASPAGTQLSQLQQATQRAVIDLVDNQVPQFVAPAHRYTEPLF